MNDDGRATPGNSAPPENQQASAALPDADELARQIAEIAGTQPAAGRRIPQAPVGGGRDRHGEPARHRRGVLRDDGADDGGPLAAGAGAAVAVERLHDLVAAHRAALSRRRGRADDRAGAGRPPLSRRRLGRQHAVRLHQAELPVDRALAAEHGARGRGHRRAHRAQGRFLHAAIRRCAGALELSDDQPRGVARDDREPRREPAATGSRTCSTISSAAKAGWRSG